jgi:hypothetical protein
MDNVKTCPVCGEQFHAKRKDKVYCSSGCQNKAYKASNRENERIRKKAWRNANSEKARLQRKSWRQVNPEKEKSRKTKWEISNSEKTKAFKRNYENKQRVNLSESYISRLIGLPVSAIQQPFLDAIRLRVLIKRKIKELKRNENT